MLENNKTVQGLFSDSGQGQARTCKMKMFLVILVFLQVTNDCDEKTRMSPFKFMHKQQPGSASFRGQPLIRRRKYRLLIMHYKVFTTTKPRKSPQLCTFSVTGSNKEEVLVYSHQCSGNPHTLFSLGWKSISGNSLILMQEKTENENYMGLTGRFNRVWST